ncbi:hypothetical protein LD110_02705 [Arthrobacter sp. M4]|nr:PaaX family transcriptional regulator C-terminal domain-containing protein [Arthrobacter sp. M4]MCA4131729.1 hypothetical protein [Arthrobacter sp. M4]
MRDLDLQQYAVLFRTETPEVAGDIRSTVQKWWDLDYLADLHRKFIAAYSTVATASVPASAGTFATYVRCIDRWRVIPYVDPGLPDDFLPEEWPGKECVELFERIRESHEQPSREFVLTML